MRVPVEGPNGHGSLFVHVLCDPSCVTQRVELEVDETTVLSPQEYKNKRLLIFDLQKHGPRNAGR